jgi:hypothetical protein
MMMLMLTVVITAHAPAVLINLLAQSGQEVDLNHSLTDAELSQKVNQDSRSVSGDHDRQHEHHHDLPLYAPDY